MGRFGAGPGEWKGRGHRNGNIWGKGNVGGRIRKSE